MSIIVSMATLRTSGSHSASGLSSRLAPCSARQPLADGLQVVARIEALRNGADILAERLPVTQEGRAGEDIDLRARVVDVVFAADLVAGEMQQFRQRIAEDRAASVAHMHRPGGVGGDVFHVHRLAGALPAAAEAVGVEQGGSQDLVQHMGFQPEIDEARPGDLHLHHARIAREIGDDQFGERARVHPRFLGQHHGGVGGEIAMRAVARRLDDDAAHIEPGRDLSGLGQSAESIRHTFLKQPEDVHKT